MGRPIATIGFLINITLALSFTILWIKGIKRDLSEGSHEQGQYDWIVDNFKSFNRRIFNIKSVDQLGAYLAIFLFVHYVIKSVLEYLMENSNLKLTKLTRCITNIVESTILFSIILGFILLPMIITNYEAKQDNLRLLNSQKHTPNQAIPYGDEIFFHILETFFYGRILFSVGYLFGVLITIQTCRGYGVFMTFASVILAFSYAYGLDVLAYF